VYCEQASRIVEHQNMHSKPRNRHEKNVATYEIGIKAATTYRRMRLEYRSSKTSTWN